MIPVELGIMSCQSGLKEELLIFNDFINKYLAPSNEIGVWSFERTKGEHNRSKIAYLAQHQLFEQIPELSKDIDMAPTLCGITGPSNINVWIGTGGTRTPLHFDSYDNILVQIVGSKIVRLYGKEETSKLYVLKKGEHMYAKQGNMSAIDCENENFIQHPEAKDAKYTEVILSPGDCLFIPKFTWHYVRSLTTSSSINFWW